MKVDALITFIHAPEIHEIKIRFIRV